MIGDHGTPPQDEFLFSSSFKISIHFLKTSALSVGMEGSNDPKSMEAHTPGIATLEPTKVAHQPHEFSEKGHNPEAEIEAASISYSDELDPLKVIVPDDEDEFIDPRLKNYPVPLVAKTVDLHNDDT